MFKTFFRKPVMRTLDLDLVQTVLFDLDGTLVDVDMNCFVPSYLRRLTEQMSDLANPAQATRSLHNAVAAMFANTDADKTLEAILLEVLDKELSVTPDQYQACLGLFCRNDLADLKPLVTGHRVAQALIDACLERGWRIVLATNPIFPRAVIDARVNWGGLDGERFHHVTAYETAHFCKPNPAYFVEVMELLQVDAKNCLMVGNDSLHDMSASQVGMQTCLLTPWNIKRSGRDFKADWQGTHEDLLALLQ